MSSSNDIFIAALVLGVLAIIMSLGPGVALMDIACRKEPNLTLEWIGSWAAFLVIAMAQMVSIAAILRLRLGHSS